MTSPVKEYIFMQSIFYALHVYFRELNKVVMRKSDSPSKIFDWIFFYCQVIIYTKSNKKGRLQTNSVEFNQNVNFAL